MAIVGTGMRNAGVDIDSAEEVGEIKTAINKPKVVLPSNSSVADELLNLKAWLDSGALTQTAFEAQKAKLLSK